MKIAGAFEIKTNNYTLPQYAKKSEKYKCPDCNMDLIFKKGQIIKQHFAHKANSNCTYYDHPSESQLHKDAKNKLKACSRVSRTGSVVDPGPYNINRDAL